MTVIPGCDPPETGHAPACNAPEIRTYKMADRSERPDFDIRDHTVRPPVTTPHRHEFFQIEVNVAGHAHHVISGRRCTYPPRSIVFVMPYRVHYAAHETSRLDYYVINFAANFLRPDFALSPLEMEEAPLARFPELAPFKYEGNVDFVFTEAQFEHVLAIVRQLVRLHHHRTLGTVERIRGALLDLVGYTMECHAGKLQQLSEHSIQQERRSDALRRVLTFIDANLERDISLNEASEAAFLSPSYLSQLLKKQTGMAFVEWVTARRIERARYLLAHTDERISEVARNVGFADEAYFTRRFRQRCGHSPSQYRREMRVQAA